MKASTKLTLALATMILLASTAQAKQCCNQISAPLPPGIVSGTVQFLPQQILTPQPYPNHSIPGTIIQSCSCLQPSSIVQPSTYLPPSTCVQSIPAYVQPAQSCCAQPFLPVVQSSYWQAPMSSHGQVVGDFAIQPNLATRHVYQSAPQRGCSGCSIPEHLKEKAAKARQTFAINPGVSAELRRSNCYQYCDEFFPDYPCNGECHQACPDNTIATCECECYDTPWGETCLCNLTYQPSDEPAPGSGGGGNKEGNAE